MESIWVLALRGAARGILIRWRCENPLTGITEIAVSNRLANILTQFLEIDMAIYFLYEQREDEQCEQCGAEQSSASPS